MSNGDGALDTELPFEMDDLEMAAGDTAGTEPAAATEQAGATSDIQMVCWRLQELLAERRGVQMVNHLAGLQLASDDPQGMANMALALSMYMPTPVVLRQAHGSRVAGECLRCLRHSFFVIRSIACDDEFLIMDPRFREQFLLHKPSPRYQQLYGLLPEVYIGKPAVLRRVVELLGAEMQLSCAAAGGSLPPWRATKSLLSKWFPTAFHDTTFRWGRRQPPPAAAAAASVPAAAPAPAPAHTITGFDAPSAGGEPVGEAEARGPLAPPSASHAAPAPPAPRASALGSVKHSPKGAAAPVSAQLWQIRTVKLGQEKHARPRLPAYVLA